MTSISTDKVSFLRSKNYWIGSRPTQGFVDRLYDLASKDMISAERWNALGNAAISWEKQPAAILDLDKDLMEPAKKADIGPEAKTKYLIINGYWLGKNPGAGVVENLYALKDKITAGDWNNKGIAGLPWDKQSEELRSLTAVASLPPSSELLTPPSDSPIPERAPVKKDIAAGDPEPASTPAPQLPDKGKAEDTARADAEEAKQQKIKDLKTLLAKIKESTYYDAIDDPKLFGKEPISMKSFDRIQKPGRMREIEEDIRLLQEGK